MNRIAQIVGACATTLSSVSAFALTPVASNVTMTQDLSRKVTVTYSLDRPAVVTLDIQTNVANTAEWVSIGGQNMSHVTGDANILVKEAGSHTIYWQPDKAWPNHRVPNNGARAVVTAWAPDAPPEWMLIDLSSKSNVTYAASLEALPYGHPSNDIYKTSVVLMRKIPAAGRSFRMGITYGEANQDFLCGGKFTSWGDFKGLFTSCNPRLVSFTNDFYMAVYPVTDCHYFTWKGTWATGHGASYKEAPYDICPRTEISVNGLRGTPSADHYDWPKHGHEVNPNSEFGSLRAYTGVDVDLPTEAQWEYACRAGEGRYRYDGSATCSNVGLDKIAWYSTGSIYEHPVGKKAPNAWLMYDMYGNGRQLCLDWYAGGYSTTDVIEPTGPQTGTSRAFRGGPSSNDERYCASFLRGGWTPANSHKWLTYRLTAPAVAK